jgi:triosephosphate isomerase
VIIGHSERRAYFGETDESVNKRVSVALKHDLIPVICVGETWEEREGGRTDEIVQHQVRIALKELETEKPEELIIAYEPVWAIGTGKASTAEGANEVIENCIRPVIAAAFGTMASQSVRVLYGGSVKPENAREFFEESEIDGALVGGASLKADTFIEIVKAAVP